ncbi:ATP-binding protein [Streptomyces sp. NPDC005017]|uniref:ATP-binding protein n=1 Tax=Streptomyces sp. NPDC005017 TaxID=3364706 RepID=UPI00367C1C62
MPADDPRDTGPRRAAPRRRGRPDDGCRGRPGRRTRPAAARIARHPAEARSRVRDALAAPAGPAAARGTVDDVLLVVTELVTNALRHGGGVTAFGVLLDGDSLTLRVGDASPRLPRTVTRTDPAAPGGFGWPLVQRLCRRVTVTATANGKIIEVAMGTRRTQT